MYWILLLLLTNYIITVDSQNWAGTFILDSNCDTNSCCCLSDALQLTPVSSSILAFNASLTGALCAGQTVYSGQGAYPTGYVNSISVSIIRLLMTLSRDSSMLTLSSSLGAACNTNGVRQTMGGSTTVATTAGAVTTSMSTNTAQQIQSINLTTLFSLVLSSIFMCNSMTRTDFL